MKSLLKTGIEVLTYTRREAAYYFLVGGIPETIHYQLFLQCPALTGTVITQQQALLRTPLFTFKCMTKHINFALKFYFHKYEMLNTLETNQPTNPNCIFGI